MQIGFVGLGRMGANMVRRLLRDDHEVVAYNRTPEKTKEIAGEGAVASFSIEDALRREENFGLYFKEEVRRQLVQRFGWDRVYEGGLKVFTTGGGPLKTETVPRRLSAFPSTSDKEAGSSRSAWARIWCEVR